MALYFYFNETTGDLVYSDQATYGAEGYTALGEQTNMNPSNQLKWIFSSKRPYIKTVVKDSAISEKIVGLTSMFGMFQNCSSLTSLDLSGFDTSQVTNMAGMFSNCANLVTLDLSGFDTSRVTVMNYMFSYCRDLTSLDLSSFDTSKATDIDGMFSRCSALKTLDLSGFDTSKAMASMGDMFDSCALDTVRCRPKQFLYLGAPAAYETPVRFLIPSSTDKWYDFTGAEVTDFSSDVATSLYSDPSKAPDGSKLVNLQDLKAALETMGGGLPLTEDTVISEIEGEPAWTYVVNTGYDSVDVPGFVGRIEQMGNWMQTLLACGALQLGGSLPVGGSGNKNMLIGMELSSAGPVLRFWYDNAAAILAYHDGMPVLTAMGEDGPIMAGDHPYGFATYATMADFRAYMGLPAE